jgi:hypothetical protein
MKNKLVFISIIVVTLLIGGFLIFSNSNKPSSTDTQAKINVPQSSAPMSVMPADKIEVVNFFGTQRCASCLTVGNFTKKTLEDKFAPELESGKIVFKEINGELPENQEIVIKYQARGSSLFVNAIRDDKDDITEDVTVWRLVNNESQFITYFENKLNTLLGK